MWCAFLLWMCLAFKAFLYPASASQIKGSGNTSVDYGGEAHYKCKLDDPKDVLQVTWQRLYEDNSIENLATYSQRFGEQVNDPYQEKILFTEATLRSTSITVRNVTWADESCYVCSFNAYPGGSMRHQTCLKVQGVSKASTQVHAPIDGTKEKNVKVIFSCSATGKPAPKIQWEHLHHLRVVEQSETSVLTNDDHTFTSSRNITLQLPPGWDGHVDCVINSGMRGERRETVTFIRHEENTQNETFLILIVVVVVVTVAVLLFTSIVVLFMRNKRLSLPTCQQNVI